MPTTSPLDASKSNQNRAREKQKQRADARTVAQKKVAAASAAILLLQAKVNTAERLNVDADKAYHIASQEVATHSVPTSKKWRLIPRTT